MRQHTKRLLQAAVGILVAVLFLYLSLRKIDPQEFWSRIQAVRLVHLPTILATLVAFFWLKAFRWSHLLRPLCASRPLGTRDVVPAMMIGFMGNNVLPAHLGEFVRMYVVARQYGISKTSVLSTIILERVLDFLAIIGIFAVTIQFIPIQDDLRLVRTGGFAIGAACLVVFLCFLAFVRWTEACLRIAEKCLVLVPARDRARVLDLMRLGVAGLYSLRNPGMLLVLLGITVVHWSLNGLGLYLATISFPLGGPLPILAAFFLLSVAALGVTLPSAPGYFGTIQYCFVLSLGVFGVQRETALAASIYSLLVGYIPVTLTGFYFLTRLGLKLSSLAAAADGEEKRADLTPETTREA